MGLGVKQRREATTINAVTIGVSACRRTGVESIHNSHCGELLAKNS
jgi:hypothetical protein